MNMGKFFAAVDGGVIEFAAGQKEVSFSLEVIRNPSWSVGGRMDVELYYPDIAKRSQFILDESARCRIIVLNEDYFPTDVRDIDNPVEAIWVFLFHLFEEFRDVSIWGLLWSMMPGLTFILEEVLVMLLIGTVQSAHPDTNVILTIGCGFVFIYMLNFIAVIKFVDLRISGLVINSLRQGAVDTVIEISHECQEEFDAGRTMKVCDVHLKAATDSFKECFSLFSHLFRLFLMVSFLVGVGIYQYLTGSAPVTSTFIILQPFITIAVSAIILRIHLPVSLVLDGNETYADSKWASFLSDSVNLRETIVHLG